MNSIVSFLLSKNKGGSSGDGSEVDLGPLTNRVSNLENNKLDTSKFDKFKEEEFDTLKDNVDDLDIPDVYFDGTTFVVESTGYSKPSNKTAACIYSNIKACKADTDDDTFSITKDGEYIFVSLFVNGEASTKTFVNDIVTGKETVDFTKNNGYGNGERNASTVIKACECSAGDVITFKTTCPNSNNREVCVHLAFIIGDKINKFEEVHYSCKPDSGIDKTFDDLSGLYFILGMQLTNNVGTTNNKTSIELCENNLVAFNGVVQSKTEGLVAAVYKEIYRDVVNVKCSGANNYASAYCLVLKLE